MGDNIKRLDFQEQFDNDLQEVAALKKKESVIKKTRIEHQFDQIEETNKELEAQKKVVIDQIRQEYIEKIQSENSSYFLQARNSPIFLDDQFRGVIPFFTNNVILIGAPTGTGKSTITANIALQTVKQGKKILVITNEEITKDVYNRVICLIKNWSYHDHSSITPEQVGTFNELTPVLMQKMTVIDDHYGGGIGMTTTIEGMTTIFQKIIEEGNLYDVVVIDYYQNVESSKKSVELDIYKVQQKFCKLLDKYKSILKGPVVVLAQVRDNDEKTPFKIRIEGKKDISNVATMSLELVADRENRVTTFTVRKARFPDTANNSYKLGFEKGRYVKYSNEFRLQVEMKKAKFEGTAKLREQMNK